MPKGQKKLELPRVQLLRSLRIPRAAKKKTKKQKTTQQQRHTNTQATTQNRTKTTKPVHRYYMETLIGRQSVDPGLEKTAVRLSGTRRFYTWASDFL